jgi:hypothetical protein
VQLKNIEKCIEYEYSKTGDWYVTDVEYKLTVGKMIDTVLGRTHDELLPFRSVNLERGGHQKNIS